MARCRCRSASTLRALPSNDLGGASCAVLGARSVTPSAGWPATRAVDLSRSHRKARRESAIVNRPTQPALWDAQASSGRARPGRIVALDEWAATRERVREQAEHALVLSSECRPSDAPTPSASQHSGKVAQRSRRSGRPVLAMAARRWAAARIVVRGDAVRGTPDRRSVGPGPSHREYSSKQSNERGQIR
jgi:hypothetical protein